MEGKRIGLGEYIEKAALVKSVGFRENRRITIITAISNAKF